MTLQRYGFTFRIMPHAMDNGEWVKASEAEAEIANLRKRVRNLEDSLKGIRCCDTCKHQDRKTAFCYKQECDEFYSKWEQQQ